MYVNYTIKKNTCFLLEKQFNGPLSISESALFKQNFICSLSYHPFLYKIIPFKCQVLLPQIPSERPESELTRLLFEY